MQKHNGGTQAAQALVEFALVIPLLLLVLVGTMDLARGVYAYNVVASAAREGARLGIIDPTNTAGIVARAKENTVALDPAQINAVPQCVSNPAAPDPSRPCSAGNFMRVIVTYQFQPVTALFATLPLAGQATMTIE